MKNTKVLHHPYVQMVLIPHTPIDEGYYIDHEQMPIAKTNRTTIQLNISTKLMQLNSLESWIDVH